MVFTKIKTKDIKIADSELKIIPSKKEFRKIRRNYNFDPDNLFVIVDKNFNLKYFLNSYKFALIHNIEEINCIILEKGEYYDGKSGSIELNTKAKKQAGVSVLCIKPRKTKTEKIAIRDNNICYICGMKTVVRGPKDKDIENYNTATKDHVVPIIKNGKTNNDNLKCCCLFCNRVKSGRKLTEGLKELIKDEKMLIEFYGIKDSKMLHLKENRKMVKSFNKHFLFYDECEKRGLV